MTTQTASNFSVVETQESQSFGQKGFQRIRLADMTLLIEEQESKQQDVSRLERIRIWVRDLING